MINWIRETRAAVVVSEKQGEVEKFRKWGPDIKNPPPARDPETSNLGRRFPVFLPKCK
jgi:hypothetical protein